MNVIAKQARQSLATSPSFLKGRGLGWNVNIKKECDNTHNSITYLLYCYDVMNVIKIIL